MGRKVKWFDTVQRILSTSEPDPAESEAKTPTKLRDKPSFKKIWPFGRSNSSGASTSAVPPPPRPDQQQDEEILAELETRCDEAASPKASPAGAGPGPAQAASSEAVACCPAATSPRAWPPRSKEDIAATRIQAACRGYLARRAHRERGMARLMSLVEGHAVKRQTEEALFCMQAMTRVQTQIYSRRMKTEEDKKALKIQIQAKQKIDKVKTSEGWDHSRQSKEQMEAVLTMKREAARRRQKALTYAFSNQWRNRNPSSARGAPAPMFMDPGNPNWGWSWAERWMAAARPWESQTAPDTRRSGAKARMVAISVQLPTTPSGRSFRPPNWPSLPSPSTPPPRSPSVSARTAVPASPRRAAAGGQQRTTSLKPDRRPLSPAVSSPRGAVPASPRGGGSPLHASSGLQRATSAQPDHRSRSGQERSAVSTPRGAVPSSPRGGGSPLHASSGQQRATSAHPDHRPRSGQESPAVSTPRGAVPSSPRAGDSPLHASSGLQRATSTQPDHRPRSSQERPAVSTPRGAVPASPRGGGSPLHGSIAGGVQRATSMQLERRPRSSQDRGVSSPRMGAAKDAPLRRTTSLRAELPRRLSLGSATATAAAPAGDDAGAPLTPSYMQATKSVKAKARCASPSASAAAAAAADMLEVPDSAEAPPQVSTPTSATKKRLSLAFADKTSVSSPSKTKAERPRRHSQPPSPRMSQS